MKNTAIHENGIMRKQQKKNKEYTIKNDRGYNVIQIIINIYLILMVGVFPLFFTDKYINIVQSKRFFFEIVTIGFIVIMAVAFISYNEKIMIDKRYILFIGIFALALIVSVILSDNKINSMFAMSGRMYGTVYMFICLLSFIIIAGKWIPKMWLIWLFCGINIFMSEMIILDNWHVDLMGMKSNLVERQYKSFTGTMGNINVNASYMAIVLPVVSGLFYVCYVKNVSRTKKWIAYIGTIVVMMASVCTRSDSVYMSVAGTLGIMLFFSVNDKKKMKAVTCIFASFAIALTTIGILYNVFNSRAYEFSKSNLFMCKGPGTIGMWVITTVLLILCISIEKEKNLTKKLIIVGITFALVTLIVLAVLYVIINFDDSFGSNRGYVWKRTVHIIREEGIIRFLFGHGMNNFSSVFNRYYLDEMSQKFDSPFIDAHCEPLQFMITTGFTGSVGYFGMMAVSLKKGIDDVGKNPIFIIEIATITSYFLQGLVNNPQVFTLPLIFIFISVFESIHKSYKG